MVLIPDNNRRQKRSSGLQAFESDIDKGMNLLEELSGGQRVENPAIRDLQGIAKPGGLTSQRQYWDPNLVEKAGASVPNVAGDIKEFVQSGFNFAKQVGEYVVLQEKGKQRKDERLIEEGLAASYDQQNIWANQRAEDILKVRELDLGPNISGQQLTDFLSGKEDAQLEDHVARALTRKLGFSPSNSTWPTHWSKKRQLDWYDDHFGNVEVTMESRQGATAFIKAQNKFVLDAIGNNLTKNAFNSLFNTTLEKLSGLPELTENDWNGIVEGMLNTAYKHNPTWANDGTFAERINAWATRKFEIMQTNEIETVNKYVTELTTAIEGDTPILQEIMKGTIKELSVDLDSARLLGAIPEDATSFIDNFNPQVLAEVITNRVTNTLGDNTLPLSEDYTSLGKDVSLTEMFKSQIKKIVLPTLINRRKQEQDATTVTKIDDLFSSYYAALDEGNLIVAGMYREEITSLNNSINLGQARELSLTDANEHSKKFLETSAATLYARINAHRVNLVSEGLMADQGILSQIDYAHSVGLVDIAREQALLTTDLQLSQNEMLLDPTKKDALYESNYNRIYDDLKETYNIHVIKKLNTTLETGARNIVDSIIRQTNITDFSQDSMVQRVIAQSNWTDSLTALVNLMPVSIIPKTIQSVTPDGQVVEIPVLADKARLIISRTANANIVNRMAANGINMDSNQGLIPELVWEFTSSTGQKNYQAIDVDSPVMTQYNALYESLKRPIDQAYVQAQRSQGTHSRGSNNVSKVTTEDIDNWARLNLETVTQAGMLTAETSQMRFNEITTENSRLINIMNSGTTGKIKVENGGFDVISSWANNIASPDNAYYLQTWIDDVFSKATVGSQELILNYLAQQDKPSQVLGNVLESYLNNYYSIDGQTRNLLERDPSKADPKELFGPLVRKAQTEVAAMMTEEEYEALLQDYRFKTENLNPDSNLEDIAKVQRATAADQLIRIVLPKLITEGELAASGFNLDALTADNELSFDGIMYLLSPEDGRTMMEELILPTIQNNNAQIMLSTEDRAELGLPQNIDPSLSPITVRKFLSKYRLEPVDGKLQLMRRLPGEPQLIGNVNTRFMGETTQTQIAPPVRLGDESMFPDPNVGPSYLSRYINQINKRKDQREADRETFNREGQVNVSNYTNNSSRNISNPDILRADQALFDSVIAQGEEDPTFNVQEELKRLGYPHQPALLDEEFPEWLSRMAMRTSLYPEGFTESLQDNQELRAAAEEIDGMAESYQYIRPYLTSQEAAKQDNNFKMAYSLAEIASKESIQIMKPEQSKELQKRVKELKKAVTTKREPGIDEPYTTEELTAINKAEETLEKIDTYITQSHSERAWYNANIKVGNKSTGLGRVWDLSKALGSEWHPSYDTMTVTNQGTNVEYHWAKDWENVDFVEAAVFDESLRELNATLEAIDLARQNREFERPQQLADSLLIWADETAVSNREEILDGLNTELTLLDNSIQKAEERIGVSTGKSLNNIPVERQDLVWETALDTKQGTVGSSPPKMSEAISKVPLKNQLTDLRISGTRDNNYQPQNNAFLNLTDDMKNHYQALGIIDPSDLVGVGGSFDQMWFLDPRAVEFFETYNNNPSDPNKAIRQAGLDIQMEKVLEDYSVLGSFSAGGEWLDINIDSLIPNDLKESLWQPIADAVRGPYSPYNVHRSRTAATHYSYVDAVREYVTITDQLPNRKFWEFFVEQEKTGQPITRLAAIEYAVNQVDFSIPIGADAYNLDYDQASYKTFGSGDIRMVPLPLDVTDNREYGLFRHAPTDPNHPYAAAFNGSPLELQVKVNGEFKSWEELTGAGLYNKKEPYFNPRTGQNEIQSMGIPAFILNDTVDNPNIAPSMQPIEAEEYAGENLRFYFNPVDDERFREGHFVPNKFIDLAIPNNAATQAKLQKKETFVVHTDSNIRPGRKLKISKDLYPHLNQGSDASMQWEAEIRYIMKWDNVTNQYNLIVQSRRNPRIGRLTGKEKFENIYTLKFTLNMQENK